MTCILKGRDRDESKESTNLKKGKKRLEWPMNCSPCHD